MASEHLGRWSRGDGDLSRWWFVSAVSVPEGCVRRSRSRSSRGSVR